MSTIITPYGGAGGGGAFPREVCRFYPLFRSENGFKYVVDSDRYNGYVTYESHTVYNGSSVTSTSNYDGQELSSFRIGLNTPGFVRLFFPYNNGTGGYFHNVNNIKKFHMSVDYIDGDDNLCDLEFLAKDITDSSTPSAKDIINYVFKKMKNPLYYDSTLEVLAPWNDHLSGSTWKRRAALNWSKFFVWAKGPHGFSNQSIPITEGSDYNFALGTNVCYEFPFYPESIFRVTIEASRGSSANTGSISIGSDDENIYTPMCFQIYAYE